MPMSIRTRLRNLRNQARRHGWVGTLRGLVARYPRRLLSHLFGSATQQDEVREPNHLTTGPLVSIVIPSRTDRNILRAMRGLRRTTYKTVEVIVVDNGLSPEVVDQCRAATEFEVRHVANPQNLSFSESCNRGAAAARGSLLVFYNDDIVPLDFDWLGAMVECHLSTGWAVGAVLMGPLDEKNERRLLHRGIAFTWRDGLPRPVNLTSPAPEPTERWTNVAAATAACLLVSRDTFEAIGGFDTGYVYGWEDVDLCLRLRREGLGVVVCNEAILQHNESWTQRSLDTETRRANYYNNSRRFNDYWAPELARAIRWDRFSGGRFWADGERPKAGITVTSTNPRDGFGDLYTAKELAQELERAGWSTSLLPRYGSGWYEDQTQYDLIISLLPTFDPRQRPDSPIAIAWVRNWPTRWAEQLTTGSFDVTAIASQGFAAHLPPISGALVAPLATNPDRFSAGPPSPDLEARLVLTANRWREDRTLDQVRPNEDGELVLFGKGWDDADLTGIDWRGHLDYDRLAELYRSADVVVDITVEPNVPAVNARVFDALAVGTVVLSDNVEGSREVFGGRLPVFTDNATFRSTYIRLLENRHDTRRLVAELRTSVLAEHTYRRRIEAFLEAARSSVLRPRLALVTSQEFVPLASSLAALLRDRDFLVVLADAGEWDTPRCRVADAAVVIDPKGEIDLDPRPSQVHLHLRDLQQVARSLEPFDADLDHTALREMTKTVVEHIRAGLAERPASTGIRPLLPTREAT